MAEANDNTPFGVEFPATVHTDCHPNNPCVLPDRPIRVVSVHGVSVGEIRPDIDDLGDI